VAINGVVSVCCEWKPGDGVRLPVSSNGEFDACRTIVERLAEAVATAAAETR
jgi:hypothetical protein